MKQKTSFVCSDCGGLSPKWVGKCPHCGEWNTLTETSLSEPSGSGNRFASWAGASGKVVDLSGIKGKSHARESSGLPELDRVLGGGFVPGSVVLLGGDPGIGKSTLLLQVLAQMSSRKKALYVTGEESGEQVALRAERLGVNAAGIRLFAEIELERIQASIEAENPEIMVVDSIQTIYSAQLQAAPGTVSQVRECAAHLTRIAKSRGIAMILVGHVTKEGALAGPRVLEHMVDTVLYFEGDSGNSFRMIRAFKNRFGAANELGVFAMEAGGLVSVSNPSAMFLTSHATPVPGTTVLAAAEGNRPFLVEVQALVEDAPTPNPKRFASGIDTNRLQMLLAILNKHAGIAAFDQNVYVKIVGGVRLSEPAADLAVLLAVHSSLTGKSLPQNTCMFGEVGLAGEVRLVQGSDARLKEAAKLGFQRILVPSGTKVAHNGLDIIPVSRVDEALSVIRDMRQAA